MYGPTSIKNLNTCILLYYSPRRDFGMICIKIENYILIVLATSVGIFMAVQYLGPVSCDTTLIFFNHKTSLLW